MPLHKGTAGNEYMTGSQTGNDEMCGYAGNDTIKGWDPGPAGPGDGQRRITDEGWDGLYGGDGDDLLLGGGIIVGVTMAAPVRTRWTAAQVAITSLVVPDRTFSASESSMHRLALRRCCAPEIYL